MRFADNIVYRGNRTVADCYFARMMPTGRAIDGQNSGITRIGSVVADDTVGEFNQVGI